MLRDQGRQVNEPKQSIEQNHRLDADQKRADGEPRPLLDLLFRKSRAPGVGLHNKRDSWDQKLRHTAAVVR